MSFEPRDYLRHILVEAEYLVDRSATLSFEAFVADETLRRAELVWDVIQTRVPELRNRLASILET
jgi:uncharacterized protein with HEPN domain